MIEGVLFDMDGVLVDSEFYICSAAINMFGEIGVTAKPEDFEQFVGMGENKYLGGVAEKHKIPIDINVAKARTYEIYGELVKDKLQPLPGVKEFIEKCKSRGFKLALATSADTVKMKINLKEIGLPEETFSAIVTGLDVENKKPAPDIYLKAALKAGVLPANCLVVEDAVSGIKAGKSAGCKCLAVTNSFDASLLSDADWICDSLLKVPDKAINW
jgi:beta-phosphoglucomutase